MNAKSPVPPPTEPQGEGREALELLYRFVAAVELTPTVAVHAADRDGIVRYWNNSCALLYGISASEAIGRPLTSLASHLDGETDFASLLEAIWRGEVAPPARDWLLERRDGSQRWVYSTHFPIVRDGAPQQVLCMEIDVTERKHDELALLEAGGNFRQLYARSTDAIVLVTGGRIADVNPAALELFHCANAGEMIGKTLLDFSPPRQAGGDSALLDGVLDARGQVDGNHRYEWQYQTQDGGTFWAEVLLTSVSLDHQRLAYAVIRDISERKETERALTIAAQVFESSRDPIVITDAGRRVVAVNQAFTDSSGLSLAEVLGADMPVLNARLHEAEFYQHIWDYVAAHDHWEGEVWNLRPDGEEYPLWLALTAIHDASGAVSHYIAVLADITERKRAEEHHRHLAEHDFLTDLPNRVLFLDRLHQALAAARRGHKRVALMFIDLDRFKAINDSYGHQTGDAVLKEVAARLSKCVRGVDTVSRQGGDEFVVILADIGGVDQAAHVAGSIMHAVSQPIEAGAYRASLSVSIGISLYPGDGEDAETLLRHADIAMYHAKQGGRNAFQFFSPEMNAHVIERVQIENKLRRALANHEFVLEYQPEINISTGKTIGVEALIRWRHPERGLLGPDEFLQVAEETGLIVPIGEWVLREACAQARRWRDQGYPVVVAVNLSSLQFIHGDLVRYVDAALAASSLPAHCLELEITEAAIMRGDQATVDNVNALRARGVQLTIDDFGTGYSSLSTLRRFPLSKLKIDRSFIDDAAIIPAIIAVARSLKLRVIAEGVETEEQLRFLERHGCDEYQGYYAGSASTDPALTPRHH